MALMGSSPFWNTRIIRLESGWENLDNENCGKSSDEIDKETESSDGLQPKQADLSCVHAVNGLHSHEI
ncbi:hypothetical protein Tco_0353891, partial [Tanacetum coccineum]